MICFPNAKVNLGLYVTGKRPDGYHNLETVFLPIPLSDVLEIKSLDFYDLEYELQLTGINVEGKAEDNLVVRVFLDMKHEFNLPPQSIFLEKRIPTGAGLGGGSSDAAFMMKMLNDAFQLGLSQPEMEERLGHYGADCPFFVKNKPCLATGIGNVFSPIQIDLSNKYLLLVKPQSSVSTREAYTGVKVGKSAISLSESLSRSIEKWKDEVANDFEKSVFPLHPEIEAIKKTLYDMHALYASMSGSGSSVYGFFDYPPEAAESVFKDCFVVLKKMKMYEETRF